MRIKTVHITTDETGAGDHLSKPISGGILMMVGLAAEGSVGSAGIFIGVSSPTPVPFDQEVWTGGLNPGETAANIWNFLPGGRVFISLGEAEPSTDYTVCLWYTDC